MNRLLGLTLLVTSASTFAANSFEHFSCKVAFYNNEQPFYSQSLLPPMSAQQNQKLIDKLESRGYLTSNSNQGDIRLFFDSSYVNCPQSKCKGEEVTVSYEMDGYTSAQSYKTEIFPQGSHVQKVKNFEVSYWEFKDSKKDGYFYSKRENLLPLFEKARNEADQHLTNSIYAGMLKLIKNMPKCKISQENE